MNKRKNAIRKFVQFLEKHRKPVAAMVFGTLLMEPREALRAGFMTFSNWKKPFNFFGMNPLEITEEQSKKRPIVLLHGNYHDQSAWLSLAKSLKRHNLGPVYTVNLPNGSLSDLDFEILRKKIQEIKRQYTRFNNNGIKIDLIGHSRGGTLAQLFAWNQSPCHDIGRVILIGSVVDQKKMDSIAPEDLQRLYEITGKDDILVTDQSLCHGQNQEVVNVGHLGLLYAKETHHRVIQWLMRS